MNEEVETPKEVIAETPRIDKEKECLKRHPIFDIQCCKRVVLDLGTHPANSQEFRRMYEHPSTSGNSYHFSFADDPEVRRYFEYHGFVFVNKEVASVEIQQGEGMVKGTKLYLKKRCMQLKPDGKCALYETRPACCDYSNEKYQHDPNKDCVYDV